jgi:RES domain-containing protein
MIYTASSRSLAALEIVIHTSNTDLLTQYVILSIEFPDRFVTSIKQSDLPGDWRDSPAPSRLQEIGDDWLSNMKSAVLAVPSIIIPEEKNYLLNPAHGDFSTLRLTNPQKFEFDSRLASR